MDFGFTREQLQLADQVRRFVQAECPLERVRQLVETDTPFDTRLWSKMAELGWPALVVPEEHGGLGLKWEDLVVVAEQLGRGLFPSPLISNAVAARTIARLGDEGHKARWLPEIARGRLIATLAVLEPSDVPGEEGIALTARAASAEGRRLTLTGEKMFVPDAGSAGLVLVAAREGVGTSLFGVATDAPGVRVEPLRLTDPTQSAARIVLDDVSVGQADRLGAPGRAWPEIAAALDALTVASSATMVGAADAAVALATDYAKVRKQFGEVIGKFQGIKHTLAEIHVDVESARSLTYYASWAIDNLDSAGDLARFVSMAKAVASEALDRAGEECVQIHGAIGYTWECDAQLYYKRGRYSRNVLGSPEYHLERVLTSQGL